MTPYEERDAQTLAMIKREIEKTKERARNCGWNPSQSAWHRAFGELAGMYKIVSLLSPEQISDPDIARHLESDRQPLRLSGEHR